MANEIFYSLGETGRTVYAVVRNAAGQAWNGSAFVTYTTTRDTFDLAMAEITGTGDYGPISLPGTGDGRWWQIYLQAGGSPSHTNDTRLATGFHTIGSVAGHTPQSIDHAGNIASILADTNELQTDWADGGRLDTILDSKALESEGRLETLQGTIDGEVAPNVVSLLVDVADLPTNAELAAALVNLDVQVSSRAEPGDAMTLTPAERTAIAVVTEAALMEEGDATALLQAIADKVESELDIGDLTAASIASAVWAYVTAGGGDPGTVLKHILVNLNATVGSRASQTSVDDVPTVTELTTAIAPLMTSAEYVAPDNTGIGVAATQASTANAKLNSNFAQFFSLNTDDLTLDDVAAGDIPTAEENATAVRTELTTELERIDQPISEVEGGGGGDSGGGTLSGRIGWPLIVRNLHNSSIIVSSARRMMMSDSYFEVIQGEQKQMTFIIEAEGRFAQAVANVISVKIADPKGNVLYKNTTDNPGDFTRVTEELDVQMFRLVLSPTDTRLLKPGLMKIEVSFDDHKCKIVHQLKVVEEIVVSS